MRTCRTVSLLWVLVVAFLVGAGSLYAKPLSKAEDKRLGELITEAKDARSKGDLERVADLLRQAIDINAAPSFRWNLARIYEELCRYAGAAKQFAALEAEKAVDDELRAKAKLRLRGLERYLNVPSYRVRLKTEGALLFINGTSVSIQEDSQLLSNFKGAGKDKQTYHFEIHAPGSYRTRIRAMAGSLERCITVDDDLGGNAPELGLIRITSTQPISTLELHSETMRRLRVRANLDKLRELELPAGEYKLDARTAKGDLLTTVVSLQPGMTADVSLTKEMGEGLDKGKNRVVKVPQTGAPGLVSVDGGFRLKADSWGWITTGASVALLAAGVWVRMDADRLRDEYIRLWNKFEAPYAQIQDSYENVFAREQTGWILMGIGAAGTVAGAVLLLNEGISSSEGSVQHLGSSWLISPGFDGSVHMQLRF